MTAPLPVSYFRARFAEVGSPKRAVSEKAYMKSALRFHGVTAAQIRAACADFCRSVPALDRAQLRDVVDDLYASDWFDLHSAAVGVLERRRKLLEASDADWLITLVRRSACWAHVDWLATKIVPVTLDERRAPAILRRWAKDEDFWVRRSALLAQLDELRGGAGDFSLFTELAVPMLGEKEFFIRKAIGWILRDISRKRPKLTFDFVERYGAQMSGLSYREATRRLPPSLRRKLPVLPKRTSASALREVSNRR
jgi:3-methyladenine DNA glycosylase AlkD